MKNKHLITLGSLLSILLIAGTAFASFYPSGGGTYRLSSSIGSTNTSINLSSFAEPVSGIPYTMSYLNSSMECGTLDPQNSNSEFISFTGVTQNANGTAVLTGVTRGLGRSYPYTASSTLASAHSGGSIFILSDAPCLFQQYAAISNPVAITGAWTIVDPTLSTSIANKEYVDGKVFGGIGGASETATGTVQIATQLQAASSTVNGSAGRLVLPSSIATSTYNTSTSAYVVPVTNSSGKLDPNFISIGTSSPVVAGNPVYQSSLYRQYITTTGTTTFSVPTGITSALITVVGAGGAGGGAAVCTGGAQNNQSGSGGGSGGYATKYVSLVGTTSVQVFVGTGGTGSGSTNGTNGQWSTFGTNGFYLASGGGLGGQTGSPVNGGQGGTTTAADLSITGQNGGAGPQYIVSGGFGSLLSGVGGSNPLGEGGASVAGNSGGLTGTGYGSGGSGSSCQNGNAEAGGAGAQGAVMIAW